MGEGALKGLRMCGRGSKESHVLAMLSAYKHMLSAASLYVCCGCVVD